MVVHTLADRVRRRRWRLWPVSTRLPAQARLRGLAAAVAEVAAEWASGAPRRAKAGPPAGVRPRRRAARGAASRGAAPGG